MKGSSLTRRLSGMFAVAAIVVVAFALRAGGDQGTQYGQSEYFPGFIYPRTQVIAWDESVARFDTTTGAIYRFRGEPRNPSVRDYWQRVVDPVGQKTSGRLEIQKAKGPNISQDVTFLVDQITGDTWILHERATPNRSWDPVPIDRR